MRKTFSNVCRCEIRTSQIPKPQQTDDNETSTCGAYLYTYYSSFWRGLMSVVYPVWRGNAKACISRMGKRTDTYAFFVCKQDAITKMICRF